MKNLSTDTAEFSSIKAGDSNGLHLQDDGGNGIFIKAGGDVGIGTTNPGEMLSIKGDKSGFSISSAAHEKIVYMGRRAFAQPDLGYFRLKNADNTVVAIDSAGDSFFNGGNVGIGTAGPDYLLDLHTTTNPATLGLRGYGTFVDGSVASQVLFWGKDSVGGNRALASIKVKEHDSVTGEGSIDFETRGGGYSVKMTIDSEGNVGIGTTSPNARLHIKAAEGEGSNEMLRFQKAGGYGITTFTQYYISNTNNGLHIGSTTDTTMTLKLASGNVGIGTTNPLDILHVSPQGGVNSNFRISGGDGLIHLKAINDASDANVDLALGPAGNTIYIRNDGNVGIGTTNLGSYKLHVLGTLKIYGTSYVDSNAITSDDRVKHNEQPIVGALETLGKLAPKKYIKTTEMYDADHNFELDAGGNPVDENGESVEHRIEAGVIAQQVLTVDELAFAVSPEDVDEDGKVTSPHSLDYNSLFTYAIAAIQEQQQIIEDLKSRIETIEQ